MASTTEINNRVGYEQTRMIWNTRFHEGEREVKEGGKIIEKVTIYDCASQWPPPLQRRRGF